MPPKNKKEICLENPSPAEVLGLRLCDCCLKSNEDSLKILVEIKELQPTHNELRETAHEIREMKHVFKKNENMALAIEKQAIEIKELILKIDNLMSSTTKSMDENKKTPKEWSSLFKEKVEGLVSGGSAQKSVMESWAGVVGEVVKKNVQEVNKEVHLVCKAIEKTNNKIKITNDLEDRANNILLYRVAELKDQDVTKCVSYDKTQVLKLCSQLSGGHIGEFAIKAIFRLGAKSDKIRPILVKFNDKIAKNIIMENLVKIRQLDENLKNVGISHDLNVEQRSERNRLVEEAKKLQSENTGEFMFRVRGPPENMKVIKIKKNAIS